jgi:chromosome segregation ATPase
MIKSLKKQLKEVLTHREQYKTTSADLDSRLKTCSIVKGEYDRLVDMINSANSSVDIANRICLSQDLKKQIDREYRELRETLESTTRSYDGKVEQLVKIVEKNKLDIEAYQSEVLSVNEENNNLREALKENANMIAGLGKQINQLQDEKLNLIEELNVRERKIDDKNAEIEERIEVIGRFVDENNELKDSIKKLTDENSVLKQRLINAENTIEKYTNKYADDMVAAEEEIQKLEEDNKMLKNTYNEMLDINDNLDASLAVAIEKSKECFSQNEELSESFSNEKFQIEGSLFNIQKDNERMKEVLSEKTRDADQCEADKLVLQEDINTLRNSAENLRNNLIEEKNDCLDRVQRAIEETEGNIGSREARKYEKELSNLNGKLRLTEEALDELKKAGTLEGKKLPAKAVRKAIKKMNQAGGKV